MSILGTPTSLAVSSPVSLSARKSQSPFYLSISLARSRSLSPPSLPALSLSLSLSLSRHLSVSTFFLCQCVFSHISPLPEHAVT